MSKNDTLVDSLETNFKITRDENFKDAIRYKAIAAIIVKLVIPYFKDKTIVETARSIVDRRKRQPNMSDADILNDEVDFLPTEAGTKDEKNTISDSIFLVRVGESGEELRVDLSTKLVTFNAEMQTSTSHKALGYDLISRAIYYGASLLRDTVPAGDTKYTNIHKVYSVWFCSKSPEIFMYNEIKDRFIHRYGIRRFYEGIDKTVPAELNSDLIEVVIVDLPKLADNSKDNDLIDMVNTLFFDTPALTEKIEAQTTISLAKVRKGVYSMIDYEARTKKRLEENTKQVARKTAHDRDVSISKRYLTNKLKERQLSQREATLMLINDLGVSREAATEVAQALCK